MALKKDAYKALEDVLGPEYISEDPVILDSYAWRMNTPWVKFVPRFEAVTLPGSTEDVQAIVKICNKYKIQFKAASSGWGFFGDPGGPGVIRIDLRRMNRILEINEKNMYAVVEPFVIFAQLQAEVMKRGLNCNITGAGSNCSALPLAAHQGIGHLSISGSYGERNQLGLEWVTPEGDIVRAGALAANGEWFCGDGPGPSLRGIIRGNVMPLGGLGVYTKAAAKLYHWPGPATPPSEGVSPYYKPKLPPNFMVRYLHFPDAMKLRQAVIKVGEAEIGLILMGFTTGMVASNIATSNTEDLAFYRKFTDAVQGPGFLLIMAGNSPRDTEYKRKVLQQIMEQYDGKPLEDVEDPENSSGFMWRLIRVTASIREVARANGVFGGQVGGTDVFPLMHDYIKASSPYKQGLIDAGRILDDGNMPFVQSVEHGHLGHAELLIRYNQSQSPGDMPVQLELGAFANQTAIDGHFGVPGHVTGTGQHDQFGPHTTNYHLWLKRIKKTFDPNAASESTFYIDAGE